MNDDALPADYPTHRQPAIFWEELGRTVATFGFLERVLGRAIFALTASREREFEPTDNDIEAWQKVLEKALTDQLNTLINSYALALNDHQGTVLSDHLPLLRSLREAASLRNVLCHASWDNPDSEGGCVPTFISKHKAVFKSRVNVSFLNQIRVEVQHQIIDVMRSTSTISIQFPD